MPAAVNEHPAAVEDAAGDGSRSGVRNRPDPDAVAVSCTTGTDERTTIHQRCAAPSQPQRPLMRVIELAPNYPQAVTVRAYSAPATIFCEPLCVGVIGRPYEGHARYGYIGSGDD